MAAPATLSPDITMAEMNPDAAIAAPAQTHGAGYSALPENLQRFLLTGKVVVVTGFVFTFANNHHDFNY